MLSYLHAFHAGNFADVHKHAALTLAIAMMQAKPSAIACFDTHAGSARYDLTDTRARKTAEADNGIQRLWRQRARLASPDWQPMLALLTQLNPTPGSLTVYPARPPGWRNSPGRSIPSLRLNCIRMKAGSCKTGRPPRVSAFCVRTVSRDC